MNALQNRPAPTPTVDVLSSFSIDLAADPDALSGLAGGAEIGRFEHEFAKLAGQRFAVSCTNGTAALQIAMLAHDLGPGDEVVVAAYGWPQTVSAVLAIGAIPVYADVNLESGTLNPNSVERHIGDRTRAILVTHLFGNPADMRRLRTVADRHHLVLLSDSCQALGATYEDKQIAAWADTNAFSLGRGKLVAAGEGGVVTTSHRQIYERMVLISQHPLRVSAEVTDPSLASGFAPFSVTSRVSRLTAAIGLAHLAGATIRLKERQEELTRLRAMLNGAEGIHLLGAEKGGASAAHELVLCTEDEKPSAALFQMLREAGFVAFRGPVSTPLHMRDVDKEMWWPRSWDPRKAKGFGDPGAYPVASKLCTREWVISPVPDRE